MNFWVFKEDLSETVSYIGLKFSEITEIVIPFQCQRFNSLAVIR